MFYSLKSKMMLTFSLLLVVPFLTMVFIFTDRSKNDLEEIAVTVSAQTLDQYAVYLEMLGRQVEDIAFQVLGNKIVQEWVEARGTADSHLSKQELYLMNARVKEVLSQAVLNQSNVASISLHDKNGFVIGIDSVYEHVDYGESNWQWYVTQYGSGWLNAHLDPYQPYALKSEPVNSLLFPLVDLNTLSIEGAIKLNVHASLIQEPLSAIQYNEWNTIQLIDSSGAEVNRSHFSKPQMQSSEEERIRQQILQSHSDKGFIREQSEDSSKYWFYHKIQSMDWTVIGVISEAELFRGIDKTSRTMLLISVGLLILTITAAYWISTSMTRPLSRLSSAMRKLEKGDFNIAARLNSSAKGEAGYLLKVFSNMANRLNQLVLSEFTLKLRKQDAEYKALLMQVNPHFLYNTLEVIGGLAAQQKTEQLIDVTESLGQMLRGSLKLDSDVVTIEDELQQLKYYLTIMQVRFEDDIEFELHADPDITGVPIIKFILQPLVENAVKYSHGRGKLAKIKITAKRQGQHVVLCVADNGEGMSAEKTQEIMQEAMSQEAVHVLGGPVRRIGLRNVIARCRLYYADRFHCEIETAENEGTKISLWIPISGGRADVQSVAGR